MNREEEINNAGHTQYGKYAGGTPLECFKYGAAWADEHPKSPKEQLISLETARLLKEKGFNEFCAFAYADEDLHLMALNTTNFFIDEIGVGYSAPSQSIAAKWLREKHEINVSVLRMTERYGGAVSSNNLLKYFWHIQIPHRQSIVDAGVYHNSYEEAMEAGLFLAISLIKLK